MNVCDECKNILIVSYVKSIDIMSMSGISKEKESFLKIKRTLVKNNSPASNESYSFFSNVL